MSSPTLHSLDAVSIIRPFKIICEPQRSVLCCIYKIPLREMEKNGYKQ